MPEYPFNEFSANDIADFEPAMKIGLLATVNPQGQAHVTMISTLKAAGPKELVWGQFMGGISKSYIRNNPKVGWLIMSLDKNVWRGKATFTHSETTGKDFEFYNNQPLFRYNAYFGVHTVFYMDLLGHTGKGPLAMNAIIFGAIKTMLGRAFGKKSPKKILNPWTIGFFNKIDNLKFLSYVGADGYPVIIPAIQAQTLDPSHIIFSTSVYQADLEAIPAGVPLTVFDMALSMEDVMVRGTYKGMQRLGGVRCGVVEVDWVYNSMPPTPGQIYPPVAVEPVREF